MFFSKKDRKIEDIEFDIEQLKEKRTGRKTNHLLHFFLTLFTVGIWSIIWLLISIDTVIYKYEWGRKIKKLQKEKIAVLYKNKETTE